MWDASHSKMPLHSGGRVKSQSVSEGVGLVELTRRHALFECICGLVAHTNTLRMSAATHSYVEWPHDRDHTKWPRSQSRPFCSSCLAACLPTGPPKILVHLPPVDWWHFPLVSCGEGNQKLWVRFFFPALTPKPFLYRPLSFP